MNESRITLSPTPGQMVRLREILSTFEGFCTIVRRIAAEHHTRHQAALHALSYRILCPPGTKDGLPAQFAVRAISRVSHQLRADTHGLADPYPDHSFDLDARCASLEAHLHAVAIATPDGRAFRGRTAQDARLRIQAAFPPDFPPDARAVLAGASLVLPRKGKPFLIARYGIVEAVDASD